MLKSNLKYKYKHTMPLDTPLSGLPKIGPKIAKAFKILGLNTAQDLLYHLPFRYDDFSQTLKINQLKPGQPANIVGQLELIQNRRAHRRRMYITEALVSDETGSLKVVWFNQPFIAKNLKEGDKVSLAGEIKDDNGIPSLISPVYEKIGSFSPTHTQGLIPIYHSTESLTQKQLRFFIKQILPLTEKLADIVPQEIIKKLNLLPLSEAIEKIHFPKDRKEADAARRRLAFDEMFIAQLRSQAIKNERKSAKAEKIIFKEKETRDFTASLPFQLTDDQKKAAWKILQEMNEDKPMSRLLNGDVGSGKTMVAAIAILNATLNSKQSALMAPTEILARQHYNSFCKLFKNLPIKIALLTNSCRLLSYDENSKTSRADILKIIKNGEVDIVIGTHSLVQESIKFKKLALAVIDEQHRFGVNQRKELIKKSGTKKEPHLLSMTATPIPRSLALIMFGDLDISVIKQMPKGRKTIMTKVVPEAKRLAAYDFIRQEIRKGRQAFVVCPLIEESDFFGAKAVTSEYEKLDKQIFPEIPTAMLHGKLKSKEKEEIMKDFSVGKTKILISTSVIEVGVDVPNATIIMIEGAERFGLAQLHQFRGRVGRGSDQSYCFLFTSDDNGQEIQRLTAMEKYADGFSLSEMDLKFRGSGEILGTAQSGFPEFKIATLFDYELMQQAKEEAEGMFKNVGIIEKYPLLKNKLGEFNAETHLE
jgi:ATP-dependent DNA helicase RecG